jgi:hypothetical protein
MELADFRQTTEAGIYADVERIFGLGVFVMIVLLVSKISNE